MRFHSAFHTQDPVDFPVSLESLVETVFGVEHVAACESACSIGAVIKYFRKSCDALSDKTLMTYGLVLPWVHAGEERGMGWQGLGGLAQNVLEQATALCKCIYPWSGLLVVAVTAQVICSKCIYGYYDEIQIRLSATARKEECHHND